MVCEEICLIVNRAIKAMEYGKMEYLGTLLKDGVVLCMDLKGCTDICKAVKYALDEFKEGDYRECKKHLYKARDMCKN